MNQKELSKQVAKINDILDRDYDHETPDVLRSKAYKKAFEKLMQKMFPDCTIIANSGAYCEASGFIKKDDKYIYYSTDDYRWPSGSSWKNGILYRAAKDEKDYSGGSNCFADIEFLEESVRKLFEGKYF